MLFIFIIRKQLPANNSNVSDKIETQNIIMINLYFY
jgi:hypothetical protein